jgi:hypothetical protein
LKDNELLDQASGMAASGQRLQGSASPSMAWDGIASAASSNPPSVPIPPDVVRIADAWAVLPPHIREAILTLVDAAVPTDRLASRQVGAHLELASDAADKVAWRIAQECRGIVQACLREEEWQDADREFFSVVAKGIAELHVTVVP